MPNRFFGVIIATKALLFFLMMQNNHNIKSKVGICLLLIAICITFQQCQPLSNMLIGAGKVTTDTIEAQRQYLTKIGVDTTFLLFAQEIIEDSLKQGNYDAEKRTTLPYISLQYRMYDRQGKCLATGHTCLPPYEEKKVLSAFPPLPTPYTSIDFTFEQDFQMLNPQGFSVDSFVGKYDLIVLAFWNTYSGNPCKNMLQSLQTYIMQHKDKKIAFIKGNISQGYGRVR